MSRLSNLKPFQKGQSGNPGGRPKVDPEVKSLAREQTAKAIATLTQIMGDKKAPQSARVNAAATILDRGWGKAPQHLTIEKTPLDDLDAATLAALANALEGAQGEPIGGDESTTRH